MDARGLPGLCPQGGRPHGGQPWVWASPRSPAGDASRPLCVISLAPRTGGCGLCSEALWPCRSPGPGRPLPGDAIYWSQRLATLPRPPPCPSGDPAPVPGHPTASGWLLPWRREEVRTGILMRPRGVPNITQSGHGGGGGGTCPVPPGSTQQPPGAVPTPDRVPQGHTACPRLFQRGHRGDGAGPGSWQGPEEGPGHVLTPWGCHGLVCAVGSRAHGRVRGAGQLPASLPNTPQQPRRRDSSCFAHHGAWPTAAP